jgi:hypothetical protein
MEKTQNAMSVILLNNILALLKSSGATMQEANSAILAVSALLPSLGLAVD